MAKIILKDGTEEYLSPGAAEAKVRSGAAVWGEGVPMYSTRQIVANTPKIIPEAPKRRRKRKPKVEEVEEVVPTAESEQVDTDETE